MFTIYGWKTGDGPLRVLGSGASLGPWAKTALESALADNLVYVWLLDTTGSITRLIG